MIDKPTATARRGFLKLTAALPAAISGDVANTDHVAGLGDSEGLFGLPAQVRPVWRRAKAPLRGTPPAGHHDQRSVMQWATG